MASTARDTGKSLKKEEKKKKLQAGSHKIMIIIGPKFCIGFKIRKSRCRTTFRLRFGSKWFSSAALHWCYLRLGRAIVHCQRNHLRKPKFSRNRAILSAHFSGVKFYNGFFLDWLFLVLHQLFLVQSGALG